MKIATILWTLLMGYCVLTPYFDDEFREGVEASTAAAAGAGLGSFILVYLVHLKTRKSPGLMTRKLSVTELRNSGQFRGTCSRRNPSVALANWVQVA